MSVEIAPVVFSVFNGLLCPFPYKNANRLARFYIHDLGGEHDGLLYQVSMFDPLTVILSCVFLIAVLFLASYVPARRAMRVDPLVALRYK